ncbi:MAG: glycosyltransferase [Candidatus Gottesmanbacteria bacterium]
MQPEKTRLLSIIIPVYKEEKTILNNLKSILNDLQILSCPYEVIVVIDGRVDRSFEELKKLNASCLRVVGYQRNHGKGYAVRFGMAKSKGNIIGFLDSGGDLMTRSLPIMYEQFIWNNCDIIIGSKLHPLSKVNYPFYRRILSKGYQWLVRLLFGLRVKDTQVGMKLYKRKVLEDVLPRLIVKKFAFDIEILAVAYYLGYRRIDEAPVELNFPGHSNITSLDLWRTIFNMLWDTVAIFYRLNILHYYDDVNKRKWVFDKDLNFRVNIG